MAGKTYFNDLIASYQLIDVLARAPVQQQAGQVLRTLPRLEAALVDARADVRFLYLVDNFFIVDASFAEELRADVEQLSPGKVCHTACG